ncbi:MAG TPA: peptidylprolyl isomerase [Steroidobacteraceae bacterium]|jgi:cyclophilin family peptidyl-prolyl cis-trans isomerase|nr:peptidylprolyl isomerase [Steroidobacteraceae bacterium]
MKQLFLTLALLGIACLHPSIAAEKAADPKAPAKPASAVSAPRLQVFTSMGNFTIELNPERAPLTVTNILAYVDSGHYTNTLFHRVVANFVIQGGGFNDDYTPKAAPLRVNNESGNGLSNVRGSVGLARSEDPHGGNAQFYINLDDNAALDPNATRWGYAVFGRVVDGMDVVERIGNVATGAHGLLKETPIKPVIILKIERVAGPGGGSPSGSSTPKP